MKISTFITLFVLLIVANKDADFERIEFNFSPSFLPQSTFTIDVKNRTLREFLYRDHYVKQTPTNSSTYKLDIRDTFIVYYDKTFKLDSVLLNHFVNKIMSSGFNSNVTHHNNVLDGVEYRISKIKLSGDTISLNGHSPIRLKEFVTDFKLLDAFFGFCLKSINDYKGIENLEDIQDYFPYGLPIRKVSDSPLEYRVWGSLTGCRKNNDILIAFLNKLPDKSPVILDLRNGDISYCLMEVFEEYSLKKEIYIYGFFRQHAPNKLSTFQTRDDIIKFINKESNSQ